MDVTASDTSTTSAGPCAGRATSRLPTATECAAAAVRRRGSANRQATTSPSRAAAAAAISSATTNCRNACSACEVASERGWGEHDALAVDRAGLDEHRAAVDRQGEGHLAAGGDLLALQRVERGAHDRRLGVDLAAGLDDAEADVETVERTLQPVSCRHRGPPVGQRSGDIGEAVQLVLRGRGARGTDQSGPDAAREGRRPDRDADRQQRDAGGERGPTARARPPPSAWCGVGGAVARRCGRVWSGSRRRSRPRGRCGWGSRRRACCAAGRCARRRCGCRRSTSTPRRR